MAIAATGFLTHAAMLLYVAVFLMACTRRSSAR